MNKNKYIVFLLILIFIPFMIDIILRIIWLIPYPSIADQKDWLGFLGSYLGIVVSILIVLWQQENEKKQEVRGLLFYIKNILEYNCKNYTKEYIKKTNKKVATLNWCPSLYKEEIKLKSFELTREEILLLYKNNYENIIKLNEEIKETLNDYDLNLEEEKSFEKAEFLLKVSIKEGKLPEESIILLDILIVISKYFYYGMKNIPNINILNENLKKLNNKILQEENFNLNPLYKENILNEFLIFSTPLRNDYEILKEKYILGLHLLFKIIALDDIKIGTDLTEAICKKGKLFEIEKYYNLSDKMEKIKMNIIDFL